ncbi:hypothetical protein DOTSEDRAFT_72332 [Dothistroma septosporum NZE10]|uniref:Uncharacterized protein n=1 Tax=Dothistroma septosporum (strain NZE10 / CBS 128990) TaxID=675120 RepID=M2WLF0_DOTSN|nr:hypothetical protein DOTSEDRAFT_72332 [Dothistroma septosporum NZE10]
MIYVSGSDDSISVPGGVPVPQPQEPWARTEFIVSVQPCVQLLAKTTLGRVVHGIVVGIGQVHIWLLYVAQVARILYPVVEVPVVLVVIALSGVN